MSMYRSIVHSAVVGAPDWFLPDVITITKSFSDDSKTYSLVAFSSKPFIHIFLVSRSTLEENEDYTISYIGQIQAHHERVSALAFCELNLSSGDFGLFTCGQDGLVRHWIYREQDWLLDKELNVCEVHESVLPTSVSTIFLNGSTVLIGTNRGLLLVWYHPQGVNEPVVLSKKFENESVLTSRWDHVSNQISGSARVAVGYKKGIIGIYNFEAIGMTSTPVITQLSRFFAHEKDICHIVWHPATADRDRLSGKPELLTVGRDQLIKLWTVSNSWCCGFAKVPGTTRGSNKERNGTAKKQSTGAAWISACWLPSIVDEGGGGGGDGNSGGGDGEDASPENAQNIIVSGLRGELYHWPGSGLPVRLQTSEQGHSAIIFAIAAIPQSPDLLFTVGQDRQVFLWSRNKGDALQLKSRIPTVSSGVLALAQSNHGNGPIAVGVADGSILLWRDAIAGSACGDGGTVKRRISTFWPRGMNSSSITALAWHPSARHETFIAYGTEAGCVEMVDTARMGKFMSNSNSSAQPFMFGSTVYRVVWGPPLFSSLSTKKAADNASEKIDVGDIISDEKTVDVESESSSKAAKHSHYVYSVCKGKLYCHTSSQRPPLDITERFPLPVGIRREEWISDKRSDISFLFLTDNSSEESDRSAEMTKQFDCLVAVGFRSGLVDIYGCLRPESPTQLRSLRPICRLNHHTKGINSLAWSTANYWLAIGSNESFITVTDIKKTVEQAASSSQANFVHLTTALARLEGHGNRITCLDWSPHDTELLLSASFDGTANVWKISGCADGTLSESVANFRAHRLRLFACLWSQNEPDLAYSGGEQCHLFSWRPSKLVNAEPPNCRRYRPPPIKRSEQYEKVTNDVSLSADPVLSVSPTSVDVQPQPNLLIKEEGTKHPSPVPSAAKQTTMKKVGSGTEKRKRPSLFPHFLHREKTEPSTVDLTFRPPLRLGSKFEQVLSTLTWLKSQLPIPIKDSDLLFILPETKSKIRNELVHFFLSESEHHYATFQAAQRPNSLAHLDSFCIIHLWLGRISVVAQTMRTEAHLPFWLLFAVQLTQSTESPLFSANSQVDLLSDKIKEISGNNSDVLVGATLLICAGRSREAIDYLLNHDRCKEALLLARLRLSPQDAEPIVQTCVQRIVERRLTPEIPFFQVIGDLGANQLPLAHAAIRQAAISASTRAGAEIEQLASSWLELSILLHSTADPTALEDASLRLVYNCLLVGFQLDPTTRVAHFDGWLSIHDVSDLNTVALQTFHVFLKMGLLLARLINGDLSGQLDSEFIHCIPLEMLPDLLHCLQRVTVDRQSSNQWSICLVHLVIDLTICFLLSTEKSAPSPSELDYTRLDGCLHRCIATNSKEAVQLIGGLLLLLTSGDLKDSRLASCLSTVISSRQDMPTTTI